MKLSTVAASLLAIVGVSHGARASSSSCRLTGWGVVADTTLPPHPRVTYYNYNHNDANAITATIGGHEVSTKVTHAIGGGVTLTTIEIDSDRTGRLDVAWVLPVYGIDRNSAVHYKIAAPAVPTAVHGKPMRYHRTYRASGTSTALALEDGLAVEVDTTAIAFQARWRRDSADAWQTVLIPGATLDIANTLHLGEIGCFSNFSVQLLERGIDLELSAELPDGSWRPIAGVPAHYTLPPLPSDATPWLP